MTTAPARKHEGLSDPLDTEWVSVREATRLLGVNREKVLNLAIKGSLIVEHRANLTFVSRASIGAYLASLDAAGAATE